MQGYASRLVYAAGQRICFVYGEFWHEGLILSPPNPAAQRTKSGSSGKVL